MAHFLLLPNTGMHIGEDGKRYSSGEVIRSKFNLVELFPQKFQRVSKNYVAIKPSDEFIDDDEDEDEEEVEVEVDFGEDVTEKFEDASSSGIVVYKVGKRYNIALLNSPTEMLNDKPLLKSKVAKAILKHAELPGK